MMLIATWYKVRNVSPGALMRCPMLIPLITQCNKSDAKDEVRNIMTSDDGEADAAQNDVDSATILSI